MVHCDLYPNCDLFIPSHYDRLRGGMHKSLKVSSSIDCRPKILISYSNLLVVKKMRKNWIVNGLCLNSKLKHSPVACHLCTVHLH